MSRGFSLSKLASNLSNLGSMAQSQRSNWQQSGRQQYRHGGGKQSAQVRDFIASIGGGSPQFPIQSDPKKGTLVITGDYQDLKVLKEMTGGFLLRND